MYLERFNECTIVLVMYHMIAFSDMNQDQENAFNMGYSCIFFVFLLISVNLSLTVKHFLDAGKDYWEFVVVRKIGLEYKAEFLKCIQSGQIG